MWKERFPHPGDQPSAPEGPEPPAFDPVWHGQQRRRLEWAGALRKHLVADAVDRLDSQARIGAILTPPEQIAYVLGMEYLDPTQTVNPVTMMMG